MNGFGKNVWRKNRRNLKNKKMDTLEISFRSVHFLIQDFFRKLDFRRKIIVLKIHIFKFFFKGFIDRNCRRLVVFGIA